MSKPVHATAVLFGLGMAVAIGCKGETLTRVEGQLLNNGGPYSFSVHGLPRGEKGMHMRLQSTDADGEASYAAVVRPDDGTFRVVGPKGRGIPPGNYRIVLTKGASGRPDEFEDAFGRTTSPLVVEIPAARSARLEVDIGRKTAVVR